MRNHKKRNASTEKHALLAYYDKIVQSIDCFESRNEYLRACNDLYTCFIIKKLADQKNVAKRKINRDLSSLTDKTEFSTFDIPRLAPKVIVQIEHDYIEVHHIIPRACGGPDKSCLFRYLIRIIHMLIKLGNLS